MPNIGIRGVQDTGKTALMSYFIMRDLANGLQWQNGYRPYDVYVNYDLKIDGIHQCSNRQIRQFLIKAIKENITHKILGITEADRVFPARYWQNKEQTESLLGLWQDYKCFWKVYWDAHIGTGVDIMLRDTRIQAVIPDYVKKDDAIYYSVVDRRFMTVTRGLSVQNVSKVIFPYYSRWGASA